MLASQVTSQNDAINNYIKSICLPQALLFKIICLFQKPPYVYYLKFSLRKVSNIFLNHLKFQSLWPWILSFLCVSSKNQKPCLSVLNLFYLMVLDMLQSIFSINNLNLSVSTYKNLYSPNHPHHLPQVPLYYHCISLKIYCVQHGCLSDVETLLIYTIALCILVLICLPSLCIIPFCLTAATLWKVACIRLSTVDSILLSRFPRY